MVFTVSFALFFLTFRFGLADEDSCPKESGDPKCSSSAPSNKYLQRPNKDWSKYENLIRSEAEAFVPCEYKNCSCYTSLIKEDLASFKDGIYKDMVNRAKERGVFYQIISGKLYRQDDCMFPFRCSGVEHFLLEIIDQLPDMEFVLNPRDWPQSPKYGGEPLPVFSFSKTPEYYDITYPAWTFWEGGPAISLYPRGLGRWDLHRESLGKASSKWPWEKKKNLAFFRGSRTSGERDALVLLSREKPELVDAQYTKNQAWKSEKDTLGSPPASEVSLEDHCQYKYLFNYRGVAASFRFKHLFLCKSLVFHVGDEWTEFFYHAMKPWVHYIPVRKEATQSELSEIIDLAMSKDDLVHQIAENGANFVENSLRMEDVSCYWKELLLAYRSLIKYTVTKDVKLKQIASKN